MEVASKIFATTTKIRRQVWNPWKRVYLTQVTSLILRILSRECGETPYLCALKAIFWNHYV